MEATRHKLIMDAMSQDHACGGGYVTPAGIGGSLKAMRPKHVQYTHDAIAGQALHVEYFCYRAG